jgi:hypothetical protein
VLAQAKNDDKEFFGKKLKIRAANRRAQYASKKVHLFSYWGIGRLGGGGWRV